MTTRTRAEIVIVYADQTMTTWTLMADFGGFSLTLKEQSSGKSTYYGVFTYKIAIFRKYENGGGGLPEDKTVCLCSRQT